jgi:uncharacterized protein YyaL (SSP411 family)
LTESGDQVMAIIEEKLGPRSMEPAPLPANSAVSVMQRFFGQLARRYDPAYGGYGGPPKFPQPSNLLTAFRPVWRGRANILSKSQNFFFFCSPGSS